MPARLDLAALEAAAIEAASSRGHHAGRLELSRREALGIAVAGVAVTTPGLRSLESHLEGPFSLSVAGGRAVFRYRGQVRWTVDPKQFGGKPKLRVDRSRDRIRLQLTNATFPGTEIPADIVADIRNGATGWSMTLELGLARFRGRVGFERWLEGREELAGSALLRPLKLALGRDAGVTLGGMGRLSFASNWTVQFGGDNAARLRGLGEGSSDDITIRLMNPDDPSTLRGAVGHRTLLVMHRGRRNWNLLLPEGPEGTRLEAVDSGFDEIRIESRLARTGAQTRTFEAVATRAGGSLRFYPYDRVFGHDRKPFSVPIRDARYAVVHTEEGVEAAIMGSYHEDPAWMHVGGCTVLVGRGETLSAFTLHRRGQKVKTQCSPAILGVAMGLEGAVVEPQPLTRPTLLEMVWGQPRRKRERNVGRLTMHGVGADARHELAVPDYVVSILRPEDLLALRLEYHGFDLVVASGSPPMLVNSLPAGENPYMVAHFAPQNIAEELLRSLRLLRTAPAQSPACPSVRTSARPGQDDRHRETGQARLRRGHDRRGEQTRV